MTESATKQKRERQVVTALRKIGTRRATLRKAEQALQRDTTKALRDAKGVVSTTRAAELVGLTRSTVYEVYRKR